MQPISGRDRMGENPRDLSGRTTLRVFGNIKQFFRRLTVGHELEHHYEAISAEKAIGRPTFFNASVVRTLCATLLIVVIGILVLGSGTSSPSSHRVHNDNGDDNGYDYDYETGWRRYDVGNSVGPKEQLRIQWHNASEWARSNPHQNGEWAFRLDDQSIIPAHLLDDDEHDRQVYFRQRYPHMAAVVDARDYIRPAWLGSMSIMIDWDQTFHDAHCVLALRRNWKAKETGRHHPSAPLPLSSKVRPDQGLCGEWIQTSSEAGYWVVLIEGENECPNTRKLNKLTGSPCDVAFQLPGGLEVLMMDDCDSDNVPQSLYQTGACSPVRARMTTRSTAAAASMASRSAGDV
ncbi:hypothetical protein GGR54DRAFT_654184 [Hypoxylon sp. NC1633]|nr:hypothetical protein GGR54DRAFT_654184 [Hypoxylon sp. NC1633]